MQIKAEEISSIIRDQVKSFEKQVDVAEVGSVLQVGDSIAKVYGLDGAMAGELLEFPGGLKGIALNLEEDNVGAVILGSDEHIKEGDLVKRTGRIAEVPVGEAVVGRVVDSIGTPLDGKGPIEAKEFRRVEVRAPGGGQGAGGDRTPARARAAADRDQGHRRDDPHRAWPAGADHR